MEREALVAAIGELLDAASVMAHAAGDGDRPGLDAGPQPGRLEHGRASARNGQVEGAAIAIVGARLEILAFDQFDARPPLDQHDGAQRSGKTGADDDDLLALEGRGGWRWHKGSVLSSWRQKMLCPALAMGGPEAALLAAAWPKARRSSWNRHLTRPR